MKEYYKYSDFAVLYRMNSQSRAIEDILRRENIPYKIVGGLKFYERKEIKDTIAYLRLIQNPSDKLKLGQRVQCVVKKYDRDTGRIELSLKDALGTFADKVKKLKEKDIVEGIVRSRSKTGMFIELANNLVAMSDHVSGIEYGQKVLVYIKKINVEKEKIKVEIIG